MASTNLTLVKNGGQWLAVTMGDLKVLFGNAVFPPLMINPGGPGPIGPITSSTQINDEYVMSYHDLRLALNLITSGYTNDGYGNYHFGNNYECHNHLEYMFSKFDTTNNHGDSSTTSIYNDKITWDSLRTACTQSAFTNSPTLNYAIRMYMPKVKVNIRIGLGSWSSRVSYYGYNSETIAHLEVYGFGNKITKDSSAYGHRCNRRTISTSVSDVKGERVGSTNNYLVSRFETTFEWAAEMVDSSIPQRPWQWNSARSTFLPKTIGAFAVAQGYDMSGEYYLNGGTWSSNWIQLKGNGEMFSLKCTSVSWPYIVNTGQYSGYDFPPSSLIIPTFVPEDTLEMTINYSMGCRLHSGSQPGGGGDQPDYSSLLGLTGILGMPGGASINNYISELSSNNATILEDDE